MTAADQVTAGPLTTPCHSPRSSRPADPATTHRPRPPTTPPPRPSGKPALRLDETHPALANLLTGNYTLVVEAAREVGGRELLRIPFEWKGKAPSTGKAQGKEELGAVTLTAKP